MLPPEIGPESGREPARGRTSSRRGGSDSDPRWAGRARLPRSLRRHRTHLRMLSGRSHGASAAPPLWLERRSSAAALFHARHAVRLGLRAEARGPTPAACSPVTVFEALPPSSRLFGRRAGFNLNPGNTLTVEQSQQTARHSPTRRLSSPAPRPGPPTVTVARPPLSSIVGRPAPSHLLELGPARARPSEARATAAPATQRRRHPALASTLGRGPRGRVPCPSQP